MRLIRAHVRAMNETPPSIDGEVVQQPLHRRRGEACDGFFDLSRLFGGMDVNWTVRLRGDDSVQCAWCYCTQGMRRDPDLAMRQFCHDRPAALDNAKEPLRIVQEALLSAAGFRLAKSAIRVEGWQQRQADARLSS